MAINWTSDQKKAIEARKGTLLVSAAAGSGKTAVLVERVIQRICDAENPCDVENLLIVTFTNAAAAQMKEKIHSAIGKKIAENPGDKRLRRQQLMLPCASICTIDSFCIGLVRENFHALGISPDFALLDEGKLSVLRSQAVNAVVDRMHEEHSESFLTLSELISDKRDDSKLVDAILKLYNLSMAYPFPGKWLDSLAEAFKNPVNAEESIWGRTILAHSEQLIRTCIADTEHCIELLVEEPELEAKYKVTFEADKQLFERLLGELYSRSHNEKISSFSEITWAKMGRAPTGYESSVKEMCQSTRKAYKARAGNLAKLFCITEEEHAADSALLAPVISELVGAVKNFSDEFARLKEQENGADFSDTLHLALRLLVEPAEEGYIKTPLALSLSENYSEILVDEYQDVNKAQDMIFSALSKNENNLFMVGDVKQSIYRFRQAMPEIFLARRDGTDEYDSEKENYPAKVTLGKNFRSRSGITEIVNFIFNSLMSRDAGGLDYDKNEFLEAAANYPETGGADTEVCLIEAEKDDFLSAQAKYAADYIEKAIAEGMEFTNGDSRRAACYGDFCILLRSVKKCAREFIEELAARGIPYSCETGGGFLDAPEIMFMISLLKIIDNPVDDIPLTTVLLSPVFGFTPDDLALMRATNRKGSFYQCLVKYAENGNGKASAFLERIKALRRIASTVSSGELVRRLIEETGYGAIVHAMKDSAKRRANLNYLIDLANKYESTGKKGVSGFIRYIDSIVKSGGDIAGEVKADEGNTVKIMTIHKSKGLEFPVCFIGACEKKYSDLSLKEDLMIAPECGIGIKTVAGSAKYDTLARIAAKLEIKKAEHSEELRVLYVALTRPKEKLIILSSAPDWNKELSKIAASIRKEQLIHPFTVIGFTSYSDCILSSLIRHPDAHSLRNVTGISSSVALPCSARLKTQIIPASTQEAEAKPAPVCPEPDDETVNEIKSRLSYSYPYSHLKGIVAKRIASKLDSSEIGGEYFASRRPAAASKDGLTPAQRGTATHRFMQYADYKKAGSDVSAELERLVAQGMLTPAEAAVVDKKAVAKFFESSLAERMLSSEKVYKEYAFTAAIPLEEMEEGIKADGEVIIIEGVADCAFVENGELVIVDFKTDRVENGAELAVKYREQLAIYRRCLSEVMGLPVKQTLIYSFRLNETVEIQ